MESDEQSAKEILIKRKYIHINIVNKIIDESVEMQNENNNNGRWAWNPYSIYCDGYS